jgi:hypothetical protein
MKDLAGKEGKLYQKFCKEVARQCSGSVALRRDRKTISTTSVEKVLEHLRTNPFVQNKLHMVAGGSGKC